MSLRRALLIGFCGLWAATAVFAGQQPVAVSPGDASKLVLIADPCPTFSWGQVDQANSYDLVVYRVEDDSEEAKPALRESFAGSASSWTPSLDRCLERGGQYAWSVRAVGRKESSEWSPPSLFEVAVGPSEAEFEVALEVVRQYLAEEATGSVGVPAAGVEESLGGASAMPVGGSAEEAAFGPSPLSVAMGDSALQVNGAAVVTTATLAGGVGAQLCLAVDYRYVDLGDGTVLDCNTGKMWLKDASCLGQGTWDDTFGTSIFTLVADLNDTGVGSDFGCTDYTEGTYTDWEVPEMTDLCGMWNGSCTGTSCCTGSAGIIDTSVGTNPSVGNAAGDGQWAANDAFVGVQSLFYWSSSSATAFNAWNVSMLDGNVVFVGTTNFRHVWPVRGGP